MTKNKRDEKRLISGDLYSQVGPELLQDSQLKSLFSPDRE